MECLKNLFKNCLGGRENNNESENNYPLSELNNNSSVAGQQTVSIEPSSSEEQRSITERVETEERENNPTEEQIFNPVSEITKEFSDSDSQKIIANKKKDKEVIILIGSTGKGKSTLANVLVNKNNVFEESDGSTSETREIQSDKFQEDKVTYHVIDTVGLSDTKISREEVLDKIAEAVYLARDGISQVFFVIDGRFDAKEMANYDLLRTIIFDEEVVKHTTIIRTRFKNFRNQEECQKDLKSLQQESDLLKEIIKSCQERVIHVDNPSLNLLPADNDNQEKRKKREAKIEKGKKDRSDSRKILLESLQTSIQEDYYQPPKLKNLSTDLAEIIEEKKKLEQRLQDLKTKTSPLTSLALARTNSSFANNQPVVEIEETTNSISSQPIQGIGEQYYASERIQKLESERERLEKAIQAKQKTIRAKVFKHILNNADNITEQLGGKFFLASVTEDGHD